MLHATDLNLNSQDIPANQVRGENSLPSVDIDRVFGTPLCRSPFFSQRPQFLKPCSSDIDALQSREMFGRYQLLDNLVLKQDRWVVWLFSDIGSIYATILIMDLAQA